MRVLILEFLILAPLEIKDTHSHQLKTIFISFLILHLIKSISITQLNFA